MRIFSDCKGITLTHFYETPPMSTYGLALSLGKFDTIEAESKRGILVRAYSHSEHLEELQVYFYTLLIQNQQQFFSTRSIIR